MSGFYFEYDQSFENLLHDFSFDRGSGPQVIDGFGARSLAYEFQVPRDLNPTFRAKV